MLVQLSVNIAMVSSSNSDGGAPEPSRRNEYSEQLRVKAALTLRSSLTPINQAKHGLFAYLATFTIFLLNGSL